MTTWILFSLLWSFQGPPGMQAMENMEEVRDTIRFIRLAESRKRLTFSDEKLLVVNDYLDQYEEKKFALKQEESTLQRQVLRGNFAVGEADKVLDALIANKKAVMELDMTLFAEMRRMLTPEEALEFFAFYELFQREVQRRVRSLMRERMNNRRPFRQKP